MGDRQTVPIGGSVAPGFEAVRDEFVKNFEQRRELGAACAVVHRGVMVVDLWGGFRDLEAHQPWEGDTLVIVYSTTKGMSGLALAVAHSRGLFDYDQPVAAYWPEFGRHDKGAITVRQLLAHQAGLCVVDERLDAAKLADLDLVARALAAQRPAWQPGHRHGYHAVSLGWYEGELIRRVDPHGRSLGRYFRDEIATPLDIEFYIGLPAEIPESRIAAISGFPMTRLLLHWRSLPLRLLSAFMNPRSLTRRTFSNPRFSHSAELNEPSYRAVEMPASNGVGTARAIARAYGVFAEGGSALRLKAETLATLAEPATAPQAGTRDCVLHVDTSYSAGFSKPFAGFRFGGPQAFGTPGAGGSFGFADPEQQLGFAYVMNRMGFHLWDDPREKALRDATYRCIRGLKAMA